MPNQNHASPVKAFLRLILPVLLLLLWHRLAAERPGSFGHQAWTSEGGLPQNSVHQILQTRDGFLWVATEGGIARFDGFDFRTFSKANDPSFSSDDICCLAQDRSGTLWAGTSDGLLRFYGGAFHRFVPSNGLSPQEITGLLPRDDGSLLVLTTDGLTEVAQNRVIAVRTTPYAVPSAVAKAPDGSIRLASGSQLLTYDNGTVRVQRTLPLVAPETVLSMQVQTDHTVWLRTNRKIIRLGDQADHTWLLGKDLPGTRTESLRLDAKGLAWVGTNRGLVTIGSANEVSAAIEAIGVNSVLAVTEDSEGDLWVGTETAGLHVLRPQQFYNLPAVSDQVITAVVQSANGTIWMGTREDGLRRYRSEKVDTPEVSRRLASQIVLALAPGLHGDLWVGTPDGLNHIEGTKVSMWTSANGLPDDFVRSLLRDDDGSIWIGTRRGLAHLQDGRVVATYTSANGLHSDLIGALLRTTSTGNVAYHSVGDLWIATLQGLSRLHNGSVTTYTTADGLAGNVITSLAQDASGALWIGARGIGAHDGGLTRYADGRFIAFRQAELPREVESLIPDQHGSLWLASKRGVAKVTLASLANCAVNAACALSVSRYGYSNGLPSEEVAAIGHPASCRTNDGELWFATRKGVAIIDPTSVRESAANFPVVIERFLVDDVEQPISTAERNIPSGHASFNIEYAALDYSTPSRVVYRYQLEGLERHWNYAGTRRTAYYTNLRNGAYRFRVEASNADGSWSEHSAALSFRVLPPFYRRVWFYLLCALLLGAVVYLSYRFRLRQLKSEFDAVLAERSRIAREIHDTLAQGYVGISIHLELVAQLLSTSNITAAGQQIETTQKLVREGLADARQSIWELRTISAQDSLPTRLTKIVDRAAKPGFAARLDVGGTYRVLAPKLEDEVLRVSQEAIANATRHAEATTLLVGLHYRTDQLLLTVIDNGKGFDVSNVPVESGHFGLHGMRERAIHIGAKLEVKSAAGEGTQVILTVRI